MRGDKPGGHVNRNAPCPCGSGKKFKNCCLRAQIARPGPGPGPGPGSGPAPGPAKSSSDRAGRLLERARAHQQAGRTPEAIEQYREAIARRPDNVEALLGLGRLMEQRGDLRESARLLELAIAAGADDASKHVQLALLQSKLGLVEASRTSAQRALRQESSNVRALCLLAIAEERLNNVDEAIEAGERALAISPRHEEVLLVLARMRRRRGDLEAARDHLDRLLLSPAEQGSRSAAFHELGEVLHRLGEHGPAYDAFVQAGFEDASSPEFDTIDHGLPSRRIAAYRAGLSPALLARWGGETHDDGLPVPRFLVGFPRSGTTMTEQVLAAHPDVVTSDEKPMLLAVVDGLIEMTGNMDDLTLALRRLEVADVRRLRSIYWQQAERILEMPLADRILVDKNPLNLIDVGLINVIFPEARVLVALRDPRDACVSCFMQYFALNPAMVNFLSLDRSCSFYEEVMELWLEVRERLTVACLEFRYEDTVRDLPGEARRIFEFYGIGWDDGVLRFHEKARERVVGTPSYATVTEPVHTRAIGRWRPYQAKLAPHLHHLERFVEALGYGETPRA